MLYKPERNRPKFAKLRSGNFNVADDELGLRLNLLNILLYENCLLLSQKKKLLSEQPNTRCPQFTYILEIVF